MTFNRAAYDAALAAIQMIAADLPDEALPRYSDRDGTLWFGGHGWPDDPRNRENPRRLTRSQAAGVLDAEAAGREFERRNAGQEPRFTADSDADLTPLTAPSRQAASYYRDRANRAQADANAWGALADELEAFANERAGHHPDQGALL